MLKPSDRVRVVIGEYSIRPIVPGGGPFAYVMHFGRLFNKAAVAWRDGELVLPITGVGWYRCTPAGP